MAGITERTVQAAVTDLESAGYTTRTRDRAPHPVHRQLRQPVPAPAQDGHRVGPFLALLAGSGNHPVPAAVDVVTGGGVSP